MIDWLRVGLGLVFIGMHYVIDVEIVDSYVPTSSSPVLPLIPYHAVLLLSMQLLERWLGPILGRLDLTSQAVFLRGALICETLLSHRRQRIVAQKLHTPSRHAQWLRMACCASRGTGFPNESSVMSCSAPILHTLPTTPAHSTPTPLTFSQHCKIVPAFFSLVSSLSP